MKSFKRIILYARQYRANQGVMESLLRVIDFLRTQQLAVLAESDTASHFQLNLPVLAHDGLFEKRDLIVVVGGDGSLLSAARMALRVNIPVIGINRGRLGFLTDISPQSIEQALAAVLQGEYQEEKRHLLHTIIHDGDTSFFQGDALNDVVLSRGNDTHLVEFDVYIDEQYVCHYRSDGLIIATPTGSTAYALSAGGPIMHPQLNAMVMVPMFSHSLSSRPLVISGDAAIDLRIAPSNEQELQISCDGQESSWVQPGQRVCIQKNSHCLRLLHPRDYHYYDTLRIKLGWESKYQG